MKALRLRLDSRFTCLLHHGWLNLLEVHLVGTCCLMALRQMVLNVVQRLFTDESWSWISRKFDKSRSSCSAICSVFARFQRWISRLTGFCLDGTMLVSTKIASWSLKPGIGIHRFSREGRFVIKTSRVFWPRVGKSITCSPPMSKTVSMKVVLICMVLLTADALDVFQQMSGRFASPPIQITDPGYFLDRFLIAEQSPRCTPPYC